MGDAMADWLAYGLETAFTDSPDIGVVRNQRTQSGLVHNEIRPDPRGLYPDWPTLARDLLNTEKANFVVMMIGLNDRQTIKERQPPRPVTPAANTPGAQQPAAPQTNTQQTGQPSPPSQDAQAKAAEDYEQTPSPDASLAPAEQPQQSKGNGTYEFHTDKWAELYSKRIDDMITALKARGVPIMWVGLPAIRGAKSTSDMSYLDELYRARADKAGIAYVDIWDGFVDDQGRFVQDGPDFEGQTRRLRTYDGVNFTKAGAEKLGHYVEHDLRRLLGNHALPVALPGPEEQPPANDNVAGRPVVGPVLPLNTTSAEKSNQLLGAPKSDEQQSDPLATRVLNHGEGIVAPRGRADDFSWPRPDISSADTEALPDALPAKDAVANSNKEDRKKDTDKAATTKSSDVTNHQTQPSPAPRVTTARPHRHVGTVNTAPPRPPLPVGPATSSWR